MAENPTVKRRYLRRDLIIPVSFDWNGETRSCLTTTVGEGGLYAQTLLPPPVGVQIPLEFEIIDGYKIKVIGEVRHSLENSYGSLPAGFGVQFLDLSEKDRLKIIEVVNSEES